MRLDFRTNEREAAAEAKYENVRPKAPSINYVIKRSSGGGVEADITNLLLFITFSKKSHLKNITNYLRSRIS